MKKINRFQLLFIIIFAISILLRISLALINTKANDDHFEVIQIIMTEKRIPNLADCWECHQPKLFHFSAAILLSILPLNNIAIQKIILQLINSLAGIITLYVIYLFIKELKINNNLKIIGFSLFALNPRLIGINIQVTNDSFVILFSALAFYFIYLYSKKYLERNFYLAVLFIILANLSKSNALILFILFSVVLLIKLFANWQNRKLREGYFIHFWLFIFLFLLIVPFYGQYLSKYQRYGSPFAITYVFPPRPGITSVSSSYLTFRWIDLINRPLMYDLSFRTLDLIRSPRIYWGQTFYPLHRTSFWTQLYGRHNFLQFDDWPLKRIISNSIVLNIGRFIFILVLLPTFIFLYGLFYNLFYLIKFISGRKIYYFRDKYDWIFIVGALAYFLFLILFAYKYKDFPTIKVEYLYAGLICFLAIFIDGLKRIYDYFSKHKKIIFAFNTIFAALFLFYFLDIFTLWLQLL